MTLTAKTCKACEGGVEPLTTAQAKEYQAQIDDKWEITSNGKEIVRDFKFNNYYETIAFVNAVAWMTHRENHHPDLEIGFRHCLARYTTHAIDGLSENDFICAAKIDKLYKGK